jgi:hypothetical protein
LSTCSLLVAHPGCTGTCNNSDFNRPTRP